MLEERFPFQLHLHRDGAEATKHEGKLSRSLEGQGADLALERMSSKREGHSPLPPVMSRPAAADAQGPSARGVGRGWLDAGSSCCHPGLEETG